ncbi:Cell division protein FtsX [hydrothermal vent metagenome]|uniref:Cell division protein FtsX n=1 Tax=hydrothermal vent metagenome TaxID=652676 RepID=A0A1W1D2M8_9ZZZZ
MKISKNHISLIIALVSILFSIQAFIIIDRSVNAYKKLLASNYSIIVVSNDTITNDKMLHINKLLLKSIELSPDDVISRIDTKMSKKNINLLKLTLPKFYKLKLKRYPTPQEIKQLTQDLLKYPSITKVEDFSYSVDTTYKLLLLFKDIISVFAVSVFIVTSLLIFKELRIWQFRHSERMNIMRLFGAPLWMRSAVLFRLAIVDAIIASGITFFLFIYISTNDWLINQFNSIGIRVVIFNPLDDFLLFLGIAIILSTLLAFLIITGHKEEV